MRKTSQHLLISIIALIFWISILETLSLWWISKYGDPLDKAKEVLFTDKFLGWRQRPSFKGKFLNIELSTNEIGLRNKPLSGISTTSKKILVLGPSSAFGWGVQASETYSSLLENELRRDYPGFDINVINAGQIGYSSWQGLEFYRRELKDIRADILIIAYGVNDVDRYRFFFARPIHDQAEFATPKKNLEIYLQNLALRSHFINLFSRKILTVLNRLNPSHKLMIDRRVSDDDFLNNITKLVQEAKSNGAQIILLNSAYDGPKINSVPKPPLFNEQFSLGKAKYERKLYGEALTHFKEASRIGPDNNEVYYYLSSCYSYLGDQAASNSMFEKARALEPNRIASDIQQLNELIKKIAVKENVIMIDIAQFASVTNAYRLFVDPVHFSRIGHQQIAELISESILKKDLLNTSPRTPHGSD